MNNSNMFDFYYDRETKIMWVYKKILVIDFIYLKRKYGRVEVREKNKKE